MKLGREKLLIVAAAIILFGNTHAAAQTDNLYQWPVSIYPTETPSGRVKTITETAYTTIDKDGQNNRKLKYTLILRYSEDQLLQSEEYYNIDGTPANRIDYGYENGNLVLKTQSHPNIQNPDREIFTMSADGRILEAEKIFSTGNYGWKYQNSYDNTGRIVLTSKYDRFWKWKLVYSRMFEYDDKGRLTATEGFGMNSELLWRDEHAYDEQGRMIESFKFNPDGGLVARIINDFNNRTQYTRREFFDHNNESYAVYTYGWDYDVQGNWTAKITGREIQGSRAEYIVPDSMVIRNIEYYE